MKNRIKDFYRILSVIVCGLMLLSALVACGDDDEPDSSGNQDQGIVDASDLVREWTLVKNIVYYSEVNSTKPDQTIDYSGTSSPKYRFFKVSLIDDNTLSWQEKSATGSSIGSAVAYTLNGDNLIDNKGNIAGKVEGFDISHSWNNLRIKWLANTDMNTFGAPCMSFYMK